MDRPIGAAMAEFIGAFALMFVGGAACILAPLMGEGLLFVAVAHGLALAVMITAFMHISGGQFNPAVSLGIAAIGRQTWGRALCFIIAQCVGAVAAAWLLKETFRYIFSDPSHPDLAQQVKLGATLGVLSAGAFADPKLVFILEAIATFFLMIVVLGSAVDPRGAGKTLAVGGFAIGLTVTADIMAIGALTGGSMNPSRSFGPAFVGWLTGAYSDPWVIHGVYWIAPILGAVVAAIVWNVFMGGKSAKAPSILAQVS